MEYSFECGMRVRFVMKKTVVTSSTTTTSSGRKRSLVEIEPRGEPFPRHDVKLVPKENYSIMSSESFCSFDINNNYDSVYERSVTTKTTEGSENRRFIEFTKSSGHVDEQPIVVIIKNRTQVDAPEWMEKRQYSAIERREILNPEHFLKYPKDYSTKKKETEDIANESKIRPDDAKRDKQVIPVLPDEEDDEDDEEESVEEYDEFEEEIVVVNVTRKPTWRKGLEIPKPQPEKDGIPIEDLLEIPTLEDKRESVLDELLIDEEIESVERPPVVFAELLDFSILDNP